MFRVFDDAVLLLFLFSLQHQHNHVQCEYQLPIDNRITIAMLSTAMIPNELGFDTHYTSLGKISYIGFDIKDFSTQ